jgi:peptidoglycan/LPS O-acetylase OafA/YrhL
MDSAIEGLRAVAVVGVLLHHAFPGRFPGGFCGVDIFFVISGYLIGGRLIDSALGGRLSITDFYAARVRRLFPALTLVLLATWAMGAWLMTGPEFVALGRQIIASAAFSNNFLLASESGYFDALAGTKPLLHLWSLGIEEQFYLVAPLLVWLGARGGAFAAVWVLRLGAVSLMWALVSWDAALASDFYSPAVRFWELATGVGLAAWRARRMAAVGRESRMWAAGVLALTVVPLCSLSGKPAPVQFAAVGGMGVLLVLATCVVLARWPRWVRSLRSWDGLAGLLMIVVCLTAMPSQAWPGPQTLLPVLGTLLVLASPRRGALWILNSRAAVALGGISYPLYLWHWPVLVFLRLVQPEPAVPVIVLCLAVSIVLAFLTKAWVEDPIRFGRRGAMHDARPRPASLAAALMAAAGLGWVACATDGLPERFPASLRALAGWSEPEIFDAWRLGRCYQELNVVRAFSPACSPPASAFPTVLLWGDSHAAHLYPGLAAEAARNAFQVAQWTMSSCPGWERESGFESPACAARRSSNWQKLDTYSPDVVVLSAAWSLYLRSGVTEAELAEHAQATVTEMRRRGVRQVIVFGNGPQWSTPLPSALYRHLTHERLRTVPERFGRVDDDLWRLDRSLQRASEAAGASYFSVLRDLCDGTGCRTVAVAGNERPDLLYWDKHHLTVSGARLVLADARPLLLRALKGRDPLPASFRGPVRP